MLMHQPVTFPMHVQWKTAL